LRRREDLADGKFHRGFADLIGGEAALGQKPSPTPSRCPARTGLRVMTLAE
jgi:hypothetical protein